MPTDQQLKDFAGRVRNRDDVVISIKSAVAVERAMCARIARDFAKQLAGQGHGSTDSVSGMADRIADAILNQE